MYDHSKATRRLQRFIFTRPDPDLVKIMDMAKRLDMEIKAL